MRSIERLTRKADDLIAVMEVVRDAKELASNKIKELCIKDCESCPIKNCCFEGTLVADAPELYLNETWVKLISMKEEQLRKEDFICE